MSKNHVTGEELISDGAWDQASAGAQTLHVPASGSMNAPSILASREQPHSATSARLEAAWGEALVRE